VIGRREWHGKPPCYVYSDA